MINTENILLKAGAVYRIFFFVSRSVVKLRSTFRNAITQCITPPATFLAVSETLSLTAHVQSSFYLFLLTAIWNFREIFLPSLSRRK